MNTDISNRPPEIAARWRRVIARGVDVILLAILIIGLLFVAHKLNVERFPINDAIVFGVLFIYEVLVPTVAGGSSFGRRIVRIRMVSERDFKRPSILSCFGRFIARAGLFALFAVFVAYEVALPALLVVLALEGLVGALHPRRQTLGDLVGRTVVIRNAHNVAAAV